MILGISFSRLDYVKKYFQESSVIDIWFQFLKYRR